MAIKFFSSDGWVSVVQAGTGTSESALTGFMLIFPVGAFLFVVVGTEKPQGASGFGERSSTWGHPGGVGQGSYVSVIGSREEYSRMKLGFLLILDGSPDNATGSKHLGLCIFQ